jgi:hypothetical protein
MNRHFQIIPDGPLSKDAMLVQRDQQPQRLRRQTLGEYGIGWAIAFEDSVPRQPPWGAVGLDLTVRLAERERFGLSKQIRHQETMMTGYRIPSFVPWWTS